MATSATCSMSGCSAIANRKFTCTTCDLAYCTNKHRKKACIKKHMKVEQVVQREIEVIQSKRPNITMEILPSGLEHAIITGNGRDCAEFDQSAGQITIRDLTLRSGPKPTCFKVLNLIFDGTFNFTPHPEDGTSAICIKATNITFRPGASIQSAGPVFVSAVSMHFEGAVHLQGKNSETPLNLRLSGPISIEGAGAVKPCPAIQAICALNAAFLAKPE